MFRLLIFLLTITRISAQSFQAPALLGIGNTSAAYQGTHSPVANPAGMARLQTFSIGTAYQQHYSLSDLYTYGLYAVVPTLKVGAVGLQWSQYNSVETLEQRTWGVSYAYPIASYWSAALGFQQRRVMWEDIPAMSTTSLNTGLQYHRNNLVIGGYIKDISILKSSNALLPKQAFVVTLGMSYLFSEQLYFATDVFWERDENPELRTGLEYRFHRFYRIRGGVSSDPTQYYIGGGISLHKFLVDMAASIHRELGASPQVGLSYVF